jgi:hypothetical protein
VQRWIGVFLLLSIYKVGTERLFSAGKVNFNVKESLTFRAFTGMTQAFRVEDLCAGSGGTRGKLGGLGIVFLKFFFSNI